MSDERYDECDKCGDRFTGRRAIREYLRDGPFNTRWCIDCLNRVQKLEAEKSAARAAK